MPDPFNVMSYYGCAASDQGRFSPQQWARMRCHINFQFGYALESGCPDHDGDGFGAAESDECPQEQVDCNDLNADVFPGSQEYCDAIDNDCDDRVDENVDPLREPIANRCPNQGICADGGAVQVCERGVWSCEYPPNYEEEECPAFGNPCGHGSLDDLTCNDGIDNDCDGVPDENNPIDECRDDPNYAAVINGVECFISFEGRCGRNGGTYQCVELAEGCGVGVDCVGATFPEQERCDNQDWDCDGFIANRNDIDGDGYGDCPGRLDCDERSPGINPNARERCDRIDNDCDGNIDERVSNACGGCGPVPVEVCNTRDDDCDGRIDENVCPDETCEDGIRNQDETDTDCGGLTCEPCPVGSRCQFPRDCESASCSNQRCQAPTCNDGIQNQGEEAIDCGGINCTPCRIEIADIGFGFHQCALHPSGQIKCWGANNNGQLGLGDNQDRGDVPAEIPRNLPFVDLGPGLEASSVWLGYTFSCAILTDGRVKCWGNQSGLAIPNQNPNESDHRGDDPGEMGINLPFLDLGNVSRPVKLALGIWHGCALFENGQVKCWGDNDRGNLGYGDLETRGDGLNEMGNNLLFVDLGVDSPVIDISVGWVHSCALFENGRVKCWGHNRLGQVGLGIGGEHSYGDDPWEMGDGLNYVDLGGGLSAVQIQSGEFHNCVRFDDGRVKCWGWNDDGQLGLGDNFNRGQSNGIDMGDNLPFVDLGAGNRAIDMDTGAWNTCVVLNNNSVTCWGLNFEGVIGFPIEDGNVAIGDDPNEMGNRLRLIDLGVGFRASKVTSGLGFACARNILDSQYKCWGSNSNGQLGLGDVRYRGDDPGEMGGLLPFLPLQ